MNRLWLILLAFLSAPAFAQVSINNLPAATSAAYTDVLPTTQGGTTTRKVTETQIGTLLLGGITGDCTINTSTWAITCTKTNGTAFTGMATVAPGTGVLAALAINVGSLGAFVTNGGALGTPSSGNLANATGLPVSGLSGLGTGMGTFLGAGFPASAAVLGTNGSNQPVAATAAQILAAINNQTCNAQIGTTYTYALGDANNCVTGSNAAAQTYTVPPNSSVAFAVGTTITTTQIGAGTITIGPGTGVTLQSAKYGSSTTQTYAFAAEYSCISLQKTATDTWYVSACDYNPGSGSGVSSFTGDSTLLSNSGSTGAVTATLANAAANSLWGNTSGTSGAPGYHAVNSTALAVLLDTTAITVSGCTPSASSLAPTTGGTITQPATPCTTATFTFAVTAPHGWNCTMGDVTQTNAGTYIPTWVQSSSTTTTCVVKIPSVAQTASDVLAVHTSWY
jgi:hypothetical protein